LKPIGSIRFFKILFPYNILKPTKRRILKRKEDRVFKGRLAHKEGFNEPKKYDV